MLPMLGHKCLEASGEQDPRHMRIMYIFVVAPSSCGPGGVMQWTKRRLYKLGFQCVGSLCVRVKL